LGNYHNSVSSPESLVELVVRTNLTLFVRAKNGVPGEPARYVRRSDDGLNPSTIDCAVAAIVFVGAETTTSEA
jgi:hypothetical protein